jgi:hypothetical protein
MLARWVSERVGASENELVNMARRGASLSMSDPDGFGVGQLWPRTFARIETNEDVVVTAISANTLEVGPPPAEEREQHVALFDRRFTKANSASWSPTAVALRASTNGWTYSRRLRSTNDS